MDWLRQNLMLVLVAAALLVSFAVNRIDSRHEAEAQADKVRHAAIEVCARANARHALTAAFQAVAVSDGQQSARKYRQFARGSADYLDIADYIDDPTRAIAVEVRTLDTGKTGLVLTPEAEALIRKGCELRFQEG